MIQQELLATLSRALPPQTSLIEAVADALQLSYDAAHRRTSLKSKLSLEESVLLARYYNLSLDKLFATTKDHYVAVVKTRNIEDEEGLMRYFNSSLASLEPLLQEQESRVFYSAKDIPLFYTLTDNLLTRFKIYVWLKVLNPKFSIQNFSQFIPGLSLMDSVRKLGNLYNDLNATEIWDITTINSTLKQINFYYEAGHLTAKTALELCDHLQKLMEDIASKVFPKNEQFLFYYNELLLMNNNVLIDTPHKKSLYVPFSMLSYYQTSDRTTCKQAKQYFDQQLEHSKLLNTAGERERAVFFGKFYKKIEALRQLVQATQSLNFD